MSSPNAPFMPFLGVDYSSGSLSIASLVENMVQQHGFNFVCVPLTHQRNFSQCKSLDKDRVQKKNSGFIRSDLELSSSTWRNSIVGSLTKDIAFFEGSDEQRRMDYESVFFTEIEWASHLGISTVILPNLQETSNGLENFARCVASAADQFPSLTFWVPVSLSPASWRNWTEFYLASGSSANVKALLIIEDVQFLKLHGFEFKRWKGESIAGFQLNCSHVLGTEKLEEMFSNDLDSLIENSYSIVLHGELELMNDSKNRVNEALEFYWTSRSLSKMERMLFSYNDILQAPLQPLKENLDSQTYEVFELDTVKYSSYEAAITLALMDLLNERENCNNTERISLLVVGAGRGPLVDAALRAANSMDMLDDIDFFALEKNPHAILTLYSLKADVWKDLVSIIEADVREWAPLNSEFKVDIVVSELLGSFGDNELSPECLDAAQMILKPSGISIPSEYTSYLSPVSSSVLWNKARSLGNLEQPYVVKSISAHTVCSPKPCFTFKHPRIRENLLDVTQNMRFKSLTFHAEHDCLVHGFIGYFEAQLYKDIQLSIHPDTHTPHMYSWFPIFFPISPFPISLHSHKSMSIHIDLWRRASGKARKLWYEWRLSCRSRVGDDSSFYTQNACIQNLNGKYYSISL